MHQDLQLAGLANATQVAHLRAVKQLAAHFRKPHDKLAEQELLSGPCTLSASDVKNV
jgi:hypothetical protein